MSHLQVVCVIKSLCVCVCVCVFVCLHGHYLTLSVVTLQEEDHVLACSLRVASFILAVCWPDLRML